MTTPTYAGFTVVGPEEAGIYIVVQMSDGSTFGQITREGGEDEAKAAAERVYPGSTQPETPSAPAMVQRQRETLKEQLAAAIASGDTASALKAVQELL